MDRNQLQRQVALKRSSLFEQIAGLFDFSSSEIVQLLHLLNVFGSMLQQFLDSQQFVQLEDLEDDANPILWRKLQSRPIDFGKLDDYMHQFKGSSSSIGAIKVKNECSQFKEFCLAGNAEGCFWAFQRVKQEHHTLRIQLESYFQSL
ncbi:HPT phosphotransmitter 4 [Prunus dulcis]|uniref:Histidine-containing phosphotransfer protein n=1 Tax=Prunus dulcis TaxID=3755 RepID=A0A4Y1QU17_PRUDU|nr:HPT phosphotransmitter 4 [Prunus dulcis]